MFMLINFPLFKSGGRWSVEQGNARPLEADARAAGSLLEQGTVGRRTAHDGEARAAVAVVRHSAVRGYEEPVVSGAEDAARVTSLEDGGGPLRP
jgi:hypothetical protein